MNSDEIRSQCWDEAIYAFGTAHVFQQRASKLKTWLRRLSFVTIAIPVIVGATALGFGTDFAPLSVLITVGVILGILQVTVTVWALVANWEDRHAYALSSAVTNDRMATAFTDLGRNPPPDPNDLRLKYEVLKAESDFLRRTDNQQQITEQEKRMGLRAALRQYQRKCVSCGQVPDSLEPTDCNVCGNF